MTSRKVFTFLTPFPPCHAFTQPISTICLVLDNPFPPLERDVIYGWSQTKSETEDGEMNS